MSSVQFQLSNQLKTLLLLVTRLSLFVRFWTVNLPSLCKLSSCLGWTMACGSGQLISDLISGRTPAIPYDDLAVARYSPGFTPARPQHLHGAHN